MENGATEVHSYITHGVLSGPAVERVTNSVMKSLVITDSIEPTEAVKNCPNIRPAYEKLAQRRFTNVRVLDLPTTFRADWSDQGLPVERSS